ncbi:MAG: GNAT family N-acetyltransferase [Candidatus Thermoplasmatota archaeon]
MFRITAYSPELEDSWNQFVKASRNGLFLFDRKYMDYHSDRFRDSSLLFFFDVMDLTAVMPATIEGDVMTSHAGLTFGGIITDSRLRATDMVDLFHDLGKHLKEMGIKKLVYKAIPHIYHSIPAEEDLYALFLTDAKLVRRDVSSTIFMPERTPFAKERRWCVRKAQSRGTEVEESSDFGNYMEIEKKCLESRHGVRPTHTKEEMILLAQRFPENIRLFAGVIDGRMEGGVIMYESRNVAHTQYIASTEAGRKSHVVDCVLDYLINEYYIDKRYFDFGISTENAGQYLNSSLSDYKSTFGARATVYDTYEVNWE